METPIEKLQELVAECDATILYAPLAGEVDYTDPSFPLVVHTKNFVLPYDKGSDPFEWATTCSEKFKDAQPYLLIPGEKFDLAGTRIGHGGGWYDKFLSAVPRSWPRIGVASSSQLSPTPLTRQPWDQPVDWVVVKSDIDWQAFETNNS